MSKQSSHFYAFGLFLLDASERRLSRGGQVIQLTPRQFELLWLFVQNGGHILTKHELIETIWPDTFVEEGTLTRSISRLRELLAQDAENQYIETIPRQGYRFIADVTEVSAEEKSLTPPHVEIEQPEIAARQDSLASILDPYVLRSINWYLRALKQCQLSRERLLLKIDKSEQRVELVAAYDDYIASVDQARRFGDDLLEDLDKYYGK